MRWMRFHPPGPGCSPSGIGLPAELFGPGGPGEMRGAPRRVEASPAAYDAQDAAWLWQRSVELTGVDFAALPVA